jgi:hypothetical protein
MLFAVQGYFEAGKFVSADAVNIPEGKKVIVTVLDEEVKTDKKTPVFGCAKGQFKMADDFDAPLNDFKDYME